LISLRDVEPAVNLILNNYEIEIPAGGGQEAEAARRSVVRDHRATLKPLRVLA